MLAERQEIALADQGCFQELVILPPRHLDGAEIPEMVGHELGIEQPKSARLEARHQMHECDLGGVARAMEHALAEIGPPERDPVEAADQAIAIVDLDAVAMTALVQLAIERADTVVDPGARTIGQRGGDRHAQVTKACSDPVALTATPTSIHEHVLRFLCRSADDWAMICLKTRRHHAAGFDRPSAPPSWSGRLDRGRPDRRAGLSRRP